MIERRTLNVERNHESIMLGQREVRKKVKSGDLTPSSEINLDINKYRVKIKVC
jgi:hypothetical protein